MKRKKISLLKILIGTLFLIAIFTPKIWVPKLSNFITDLTNNTLVKAMKKLT